MWKLLFFGFLKSFSKVWSWTVQIVWNYMNIFLNKNSRDRPYCYCTVTFRRERVKEQFRNLSTNMFFYTKKTYFCLTSIEDISTTTWSWEKILVPKMISSTRSFDLCTFHRSKIIFKHHLTSSNIEKFQNWDFRKIKKIWIFEIVRLCFVRWNYHQSTQNEQLTLFQTFVGFPAHAALSICEIWTQNLLKITENLHFEKVQLFFVRWNYHQSSGNEKLALETNF